MKLLLHACCGPCACYPTEKLVAEGQDLTILYFNPNIHPYKEFKQRLSTLREFCEKKQLPLIFDKAYPLEETLRGMCAEPLRCTYCYRVRMEYAAKMAKDQGFEAFSTTLLVSPYQRHELIKKIAQEAGEKYGIPFYYEDFRPGYQRGVDISLELGLYRQQYCGCVFSERDRYEIKKQPKAQEEPAGSLVRISRLLTMVKR